MLQPDVTTRTLALPDRSTKQDPSYIPLTLVQEGERLMRICNACRYCEGFCAVFPAMERRLTFSEADLAYLANLCHDCGECYHSCQYAPPHEFAVNVPHAFAEIRRETYRAHLWPRLMTGWFTHPIAAFLVAAVAAPAVFLLWLESAAGQGVLFAPHSDAEGSFYRVLSHDDMVTVFGAFGLLALLALGIGVVRFWHHQASPLDSARSALSESRRAGLRPTASDFARAISDAFTLRYLEGGGDGCAYPADTPSQARRWFHHLTFYGFLLCLASTTVAALYDNVLGWEAPYAVISIPVMLGCLGGIGLLVGPAGLVWLKTGRNPALVDPAQTRLDVSFIVMLLLTSLTGFLLLVLRERPAMGVLLGIHLGIVAGLFAMMPYGKFVHGLYRFAALVRYAQETRAVNTRRHRTETTHDDE